MTMHKYTRETILSFICAKCHMWWSYATTDYIPKEQACPHCGFKAKIEEKR